MKHIAGFTLLLFLLASAGVSAQGFYSNNAIVSVSSGTVVSIPDSLVNNGTLINNGEIQIAGAWINTGTYNAGSGQINFNGNLDQTINHNAQSIERLVISGGGEKEFLADITVQSTLNLSAGNLVSRNGARLIMDQDVVITGGSNNSHIIGSVERKGTGDWLFPIGNGTKYLPIVVSGVNNATAFGIVTLHELAQGESLTGSAELERLSTERYWELVTGGGAIGGTHISLPVVDEEAIGNSDFITVAGSNNATGPYSDMLKQSFVGNLSEGIVTSEGSPTFKFYTVAAALSDRSVQVFNAVSANGDGKNDYMEIRNIVFFPGNKVVVHNRWGDRVFEMTDYDNSQNVFRGIANNGTRLPAGTYFYSIDLNDGSKKITGYVVLK